MPGLTDERLTEIEARDIHPLYRQDISDLLNEVRRQRERMAAVAAYMTKLMDDAG